MKKFSIISALAAALLLTSCAKNISSNEYSENEVGSVKQTYRGVILNVRNVTVQGGDSLSDNTMGLAGGGIGGALLGSQLGKGRGQVVGGVLGAAAGALGGALLEKKLKEQDGVEYTVELTSGRIMTVVQGPEPRLQSGQAVLVMVGNGGRSRVVADQTGGASYGQTRFAPTMAPAPAPRNFNNNNYVPQSNGIRQETSPRGYANDLNNNYVPTASSENRFDAVDMSHRDAYARDLAERSSAPRMIVQ